MVEKKKGKRKDEGGLSTRSRGIVGCVPPSMSDIIIVCAEQTGFFFMQGPPTGVVVNDLMRGLQSGWSPSKPKKSLD